MRKKIKIVVIILILIVAAGAIVAMNLPMPKALVSSDARYDLAALADGIYPGECDNGLVQVNVEVTVKDHAIADIALIRHQNGMGSSAERIVQDVVDAQSVEVDNVAGATYSSQSILKAIENALSEGESQ